MWSANMKKQLGCNGDGESLAFRICRRSCGFCNAKLYQQARNSKKCPKQPLPAATDKKQKGRGKSRVMAVNKTMVVQPGIPVTTVFPLPTPPPYTGSTVLPLTTALPSWPTLPSIPDRPIPIPPYPPIYPELVRPLPPVVAPPPFVLPPATVPPPPTPVWPAPQPWQPGGGTSPTTSYVVDAWGRLQPLTWRPITLPFPIQHHPMNAL